MLRPWEVLLRLQSRKVEVSTCYAAPWQAQGFVHMGKCDTQKSASRLQTGSHKGVLGESWIPSAKPSSTIPALQTKTSKAAV